MVKENNKVRVLKKATYREIKEKMLTTKWVADENFPNSLFTDPYDTAYLHAGICRFGDVGYLLTPYGYIRANMLQRKIYNSLIPKESNKKYIK